MLLQQRFSGLGCIKLPVSTIHGRILLFVILYILLYDSLAVLFDSLAQL